MRVGGVGGGRCYGWNRRYGCGVADIDGGGGYGILGGRYKGGGSFRNGGSLTPFTNNVYWFQTRLHTTFSY